MVEKGHLTEDLSIGEGVDRVAVDLDGHPSSLDGEHAVPDLALLEDDRSRRVNNRLGRIAEQAKLARVLVHRETDCLVRAERAHGPGVDSRVSTGAILTASTRRRQGAPARAVSL